MEEKKFCPHCGAPNESSNTFCGSCGASLTGESKQPTPSPSQAVYTQPVKTQPASVVHVYQKPVKEQKTTVIGILGLVIGILGLAVFSWLSLYVWVWMVYLFLGLCVVGVILSVISIKNNTAIGVTGLVLSILGVLAQIGWAIIVSFFYYLFY